MRNIENPYYRVYYTNMFRKVHVERVLYTLAYVVVAVAVVWALRLRPTQQHCPLHVMSIRVRQTTDAKAQYLLVVQ